jgi:undecaprenyl-diphosphatase
VVLVWTFARRGRWWVAPLLLVPPLVAVARLYEGAHHLSDVLTSLLYASAWLTATTIVLLNGGTSPGAGGRTRRAASVG